MKISKKRVISVLDGILDYACMHLCCHEDTHRGGAIWEICDHCGMKWADDEGGKPEDAHDIPQAINDGYDLLAEIRRGS